MATIFRSKLAISPHQSGKEYTIWFMGTADLMISVHSFFTQTPAEEYIEVLQDPTIQSISWLQL